MENIFRSNKKLQYALVFLLFIGLFFVLQFASIRGVVTPFAFGMMFALVWANQKVWLVCPAYFIASIAYSQTFENIIAALVAVFVCALPYYIHVLCKKNMFKWEVYIYAALSQTATIVFSAIGGVHWILILAHAIVGLAFMAACIHIFEPLIIRGFAYKLTSSELICGAIIFAILSDGLAGFTLAGFSFLKLVIPFLLLCVSYTTKGYNACLLAGVLGLGTMLGSNNAVYVAPMVVWSLAITALRSRTRIFPALALVISELLCGYYFTLYYSYTWLEILPVVIGCLIFVVLPTKWYDQIAVLLSSNSDRLAMKNIVNRNREVLSRRLNNLSEVFCDMDSVFRKLIKQSLSEEEVKTMLFEEVRGQICKGCPEYKHCHRTFSADTKNMFEELIQISLEKGKITLLDIPSYLTSRCGKTNALIGEINTLTSQYKNYSSLVGNVDTSKMLIAEQLGGISNIMKGLAKEVDLLVSFDAVRENKIIDELAYNNIICTDAVVYEKDARTMMASLIVRDEDVDRMKLREVVSKVCGNKMMPYEVYPSSKAGLKTINLKTASRYDCVFGLANQNKSGSTVSGDCHTVLRLDGDKFMFAVCDGMGSGDKASEKSETAIGLIENFYKAGFDNETILSSVNQLLNLEKDEIFSTLDICVVDLRSGIADFVKMGSPSSYIRSSEECKIIEGGALPVGVIQNANALTKKVVVGEKDFIVICSDGVSDAFGSDGEMQDYIMTIKTANPQEFANAILEKALLSNNGYAVDDMTVLVVKIFQQ